MLNKVKHLAQKQSEMLRYAQNDSKSQFLFANNILSNVFNYSIYLLT